MTQSYNLSQLANNLNTAGQLDATDGLVNAVPPANGGTGQSTYTIGDILYASGATALAKLSDVATGNVLISGGVGASPSYGKVGLTTHVSGTLPIANGGTNSTATPTAGGIVYGDGTSHALTAAGTTGQLLTSNGSSAPTWASNQSIGVGQTWTNMLSPTVQRAAGQTYTNNTGKPIQVAIYVAGGNNTQAALTVGSIVVSQTVNATGNPFGVTLSAIVPSSSTYVVTVSGMSVSIWSELR